MNERIRELIEQATVEVPLYYGPAGLSHTKKFNKEKFAELIIKECAEICYDHSRAAGGDDTAFGYGYKDCGNDIKQHFGVE
jgi:hypothetical protein